MLQTWLTRLDEHAHEGLHSRSSCADRVRLADHCLALQLRFPVLGPRMGPMGTMLPPTSSDPLRRLLLRLMLRLKPATLERRLKTATLERHRLHRRKGHHPRHLSPPPHPKPPCTPHRCPRVNVSSVPSACRAPLHSGSAPEKLGLPASLKNQRSCAALLEVVCVGRSAAMARTCVTGVL